MKTVLLLFTWLSVTTWPLLFFGHTNGVTHEAVGSIEKVQAGKGQEDFKVGNNPSIRKLTIEFSGKESGKGMISVYYTDGKLLGRKEVVVNAGVNVWEYYFPSTATGIFLVKFTTKNTARTVEVYKKVKQN